MKRIISILLVLLTVLSSLPLCITAENSITDGAVTWTYDESTETLTVSGEGDMPDYEWISTEDHREGVTRLPEQWTKAKHVVIEEGVTSIGDWAFIWFEEMEDISLPETLTKIGKGAFENTYLYTIEFPASLRELEGCFHTTEPPKAIIFKGDAPSLDNWSDFTLTVTFEKGPLTTICYPEDNATWTDEVKSAFGPRITWNGEIPERPLAPDTFDDVNENAWYCDSVQYVYERGLMIGVDASTFGSDMALTRAQAMQMLFNMSGEDAADYQGQTPFTDVSSSAWCAPCVNWAVELGITKGVSATKFAPNKYITRQELAAMLKRFKSFLDCGYVEDADLSVYEDVDKVDNWAYLSMCWCVGAGIISGTSETTLSPTANTTRAQTARMLMQFNSFVLDNIPVTTGAYKVLADFIMEKGEIAAMNDTGDYRWYVYTINEGDSWFLAELTYDRGKICDIEIKYYPAFSEDDGDNRNMVRISRMDGLESKYNCVCYIKQPSYRLVATGYLTPDEYDVSDGLFSYSEWNGTEYVSDDSTDIIGIEKRDTEVARMLEYLNRMLAECGLEYKDLFING